MNQEKKIDRRITALRRFAISITLFNIAGHAFLGFEQSWLHPFIALGTAYSMEILLEFLLTKYITKQAPRFTLGGFTGFVDFLLPAHISGLAIGMLIYPGGEFWVLAFAVAVCIGSKMLFRVPVGNRSRHFLNPSNFGIAVTLILFPWVGISPPYHFTANIVGIPDIVFPFVFIGLGSMLNFGLTNKGPLIWAWLGGFVLQAVLRAVLFGASLIPALMPMTGVAFLLFTFYMVTDPGTTPFETRAQIGFGLSVAMMYGLLVTIHIVFGLFFALVLVSAIRGLGLYTQHLLSTRRETTVKAPILTATHSPMATHES